MVKNWIYWLIQNFPSTSPKKKGLENTAIFLTVQEVTRAHKKENWALDSVVINNKVLKVFNEQEVTEPPTEGVYIRGLSLDGAGWDKKAEKLCEQQNKVRTKFPPTKSLPFLCLLHSNAIQKHRLHKRSATPTHTDCLVKTKTVTFPPQ